VLGVHGVVWPKKDGQKTMSHIKVRGEQIGHGARVPHGWDYYYYCIIVCLGWYKRVVQM
jgi:hypothetical protein